MRPARETPDCNPFFLFLSAEFQASPDVVIRVTEPVIRVRIRETALRTVIRVTANNEELHGIFPFRASFRTPSPTVATGEEEGWITAPQPSSGVFLSVLT